ncbi:hypothetical protein RNN91_04110 [Mycoplasmopsis felis]|uniref:hypothetical protein n=1 Tax=Mycoplasmopsis felis TaxID=33923 RepID=UPI002AF6C30E|nr:hypothetical protein [Mycoplasmopsis felis]WQQ01962.1 hypothetical protein RRG54_01220 [Mycoplasmopsis felis]
MLAFLTPLRGCTPSKKSKKMRSISRNLKAEEFYKIYQEYNSTGVHGALNMLFKISPKVQNNKKKNNVWRIKKIINPWVSQLKKKINVFTLKYREKRLFFYLRF